MICTIFMICILLLFVAFVMYFIIIIIIIIIIFIIIIIIILDSVFPVLQENGTSSDQYESNSCRISDRYDLQPIWVSPASCKYPISYQFSRVMIVLAIDLLLKWL